MIEGRRSIATLPS